MEIENWSEQGLPAGSAAPADSGIGQPSPETGAVANNSTVMNVTTTGASGDEARPGPHNREEAVRAQFTPRQTAGAGTAERKYGNMQDVIDYLERRKAAIHLPSDEDIAKEKRRRKTNTIISAIADGASALSNLIFTTRYAPNAYQNNNMTDATRERFDRMQKEREAEEDRYYNLAMTIGKLKDAEEQKQYQRGLDRLRQQYAAAEEQRKQNEEKRKQNAEDREAGLYDDKKREQKNKADEAGHKATVAATDAEYAPKKNAATIDYINAGTDQRKAAAGASKAAAVASYASANKSNNDSVYAHFDGKAYYNKDDFAKAVYRKAREYNKRHHNKEDGAPDEVPVPTYYRKRNASGGEEYVRYSAADVAASLEPLLEQERKQQKSDNTPPSRRKADNDNTPPSRR